MGSNVRQEAIKSIVSTKHKLDLFDFKTTHVKDLFGSLVFSEEVMKQRLPKPIFKSIRRRSSTARRSIRRSPTPWRCAMKDWAVEHGATHYTHLFQPMTGITAEKHDSFLVARRRWRGAGGIQRQGARQGRARRLVVPLRRPSRDLRSPRLHRLGPDQPRLHRREPQRLDARHPDRIPQLDRRGPRQEDPPAPLDGSPLARRRSASSSSSARTSTTSSPPSAPSRNTS